VIEEPPRTTSSYLVPVAETVFVIPAKAGIQFFALEPCFRYGDIVDFRFPQQILFRALEAFNSCVSSGLLRPAQAFLLQLTAGKSSAK